MRRLMLLALVLLAGYSSAIERSDFSLDTSKGIQGVVTDWGHGCQYYTVSGERWSTDEELPIPTSELFGDNPVSNGHWEFLLPGVEHERDVWEPKIECKNETGENGTYENCTDNGKFKKEKYYTDDWTSMNATHKFKAKENTSLRYCADYGMLEIGSGWGVSVDMVPTFAGNTYPEYAWWNASWQYRAECAISTNVPGSLSNFPAHCILDTQTLIAAGQMKSDCSDLRAINSSETGMLDYEIEACNTTFTAVHVRIPVTGLLNTIYIYSGNPSALDAQNETGVWQPAGYVAVYHFDEASGNLTDSAGYNNLTYTQAGLGTATYHITSDLGYGINVTSAGTLNYVRFSKSSPTGLPSGNKSWTTTVIAMKSTNNGANGGCWLRWGTYAANGQIYINQLTSPTVLRVGGYNTNTQSVTYEPFQAWQYYSFNSSTGTTMTVWKNGTLNGTYAADINTVGTTSMDFAGNTHTSGDYMSLGGTEWRIRNSTSSADWIKAEHLQTSTMGEWESLGIVSTNMTSPTNTTYPYSVPFAVSCSGTFTNYLLNISVDGAVNISDVALANASAYTTSLTFLAGAHNASATCFNGTSTNTTDTVFFTVVDAPTVTAYTPLNGTTNLSSTIPFGYSATSPNDATLNCSIYLNGTLNHTDATYASGTTGQFVISGLSNGAYAWGVRCYGSLGNYGDSATQEFSVYDSSGGGGITGGQAGAITANALISIAGMGVFLFLFHLSKGNEVMSYVWLSGLILVMTYAMAVQRVAFDVSGLDELGALAFVILDMLIYGFLALFFLTSIITANIMLKAGLAAVRGEPVKRRGPNG